jgi:hypothetical protein
VHARHILSKTKYRDETFTENSEENEIQTSNSIRRLHHLQQKNFHLTSDPCSLVSLSGSQGNRSDVFSTSRAGPPIENEHEHGRFSHINRKISPNSFYKARQHTIDDFMDCDNDSQQTSTLNGLNNNSRPQKRKRTLPPTSQTSYESKLRKSIYNKS